MFWHQTGSNIKTLHEGLSRPLCDDNILIIWESATVLLMTTEDSLLLLAAQVHNAAVNFLIIAVIISWTHPIWLHCTPWASKCRGVLVHDCCPWKNCLRSNHWQWEDGDKTVAATLKNGHRGYMRLQTEKRGSFT